MTDNTKNLPFAKRYGYEPVESPFQMDFIDKILRIEFWNAFYIFVQTPLEKAEPYSKNSYQTIYKIVWVHFFKRPLDDFPQYDHHLREYFRKFILPLLVVVRSVPTAAAVVGMQPRLAAQRTNNRNEKMQMSLVS